MQPLPMSGSTSEVWHVRALSMPTSKSFRLAQPDSIAIVVAQALDIAMAAPTVHKVGIACEEQVSDAQPETSWLKRP
jgi:hypothetical protein